MCLIRIGGRYTRGVIRTALLCFMFHNLPMIDLHPPFDTFLFLLLLVVHYLPFLTLREFRVRTK